MTRLVGMHELKLVDGADPAEYESRMAASLETGFLPGIKVVLLKGERGPRTGEYAHILDMEGVEVRDRYFPGPDSISAEAEAWAAEHPEALEAWQSSSALESDAQVVTDYLVVGEAAGTHIAPRMLALHELQFAEGADPEEFEHRFVGSEAQTPIPGFRTHLLKGERGVRAGKYALLTEIESVELRDRYFPADGQGSTPWDQWLDEHPSLREAVEHAWELLAGDVTTDYLIVGA